MEQLKHTYLTYPFFLRVPTSQLLVSFSWDFFWDFSLDISVNVITRDEIYIYMGTYNEDNGIHMLWAHVPYRP